MKRYDITNTSSIDVKRFYLPLTIKLTCPKCNTVNDHNLNDNYLSYPTINNPEDIGVYCKKCEDYFNASITLKIAIEVNDTRDGSSVG